MTVSISRKYISAAFTLLILIFTSLTCKPILAGNPGIIDSSPYYAAENDNLWTDDFSIIGGPVIVNGNLEINGANLTCAAINQCQAGWIYDEEAGGRYGCESYPDLSDISDVSFAVNDTGNLVLKNSIINIGGEFQQEVFKINLTGSLRIEKTTINLEELTSKPRFSNMINLFCPDDSGNTQNPINLSDITINGMESAPVVVFRSIWNPQNLSYNDKIYSLSGENRFDKVDIKISGLSVVSGKTVISDSRASVDVIVENGTLTFDNTELEGYIFVKDGAVLEIINGSVLDLHDVGYNSAIRVEDGGTLIIRDSVVHNANGSKDDAFIVTGNGIVDIRNSTIKDNRNNSSFGHILSVDGGTVTITDSEIYNNHIGMHDHTINPGGGAFFANNHADITISNVGFYNNQAGNGGAICVEDSTISIGGGSIFENNESNHSNIGGGAVSAVRSDVTITDGTFKGNEAYNYGGAIALYGGSLTLGQETEAKNVSNGSASGPEFIGNKVIAEGSNPSGGAILIASDCGIKSEETCKNLSASLLIYNASFEENKSNFQGGAVCIGDPEEQKGTDNKTAEQNVTAVIRKAVFIGNEADYQYLSHSNTIGGGAIAIQKNGKLTMKNAAMVDNTTDAAGGAIASGWTGRNYLYPVQGAAIFNNHARLPEASDTDIFVLVGSGINHVISEKMFNNSSHNWEQNETRVNDYDTIYIGSAWKSSPEDTEGIESSADVLFIENKSIAAHPSLLRGCGGAIGNNGVLILGEKEEREQKPEPIFFRLDEFPRTGFSQKSVTALSRRPFSIGYIPLDLRLELPVISTSAEIVTVPYSEGDYPVQWLGEQAGLLEGSAMPGKGISVIAAHNHLNTMEAGPFAFLSSLQEGDRLFIRNKYNEMQTFIVYASKKIASNDSAELEKIASMYDRSLTLITCEDESPDGGYFNRHIVAAFPAQ